MPTALPRIQVTRTDEVERALEVAERLWPDLALSERLARLAAMGAQAAVDAETSAQRRADRRKVLEQYQGKFAVDYPPGYLENLRKDGPE